MAVCGVHVNLEVEADGQSIRIVAVNEGGQLSKQVKPLDRLVSVNGQSVSGKQAEEVLSMLSGSDGSEVALSLTRPAESGTGEKSCTVLRTSSPEVDRQVATLKQIQNLVLSKEDPVYWRPATSPDGKVFGEVVSSIKDLKSKAGSDGIFGLGSIFKWLMAPFSGAGASQPDTVPTPQPQAGNYSQVLVLRLGTGDYFGEIALVSNKPRQATVKAFGNATVLVMSRDAFTRLCGPLMDILRRNLDNYSNMELPSPEEVSGPGLEKGHVSFSDEESAPEFREETVERKPRRGRERRKSVYVESVKLEADWQPPSYEKEEAEKERLSEHIGKTALLASLDTKARDTVIMAVQKQTFSKDEDVIVQGDPGDYFYILDAGAADVLIKQQDGSELKVLEYKPGGSFGELALLHGEPRLATVRATEAVTVWKLDRDTFRKIMMSTGKQSMDERTKFLNKVSILNDLSTFEKFKLAESMEVRQYKDDEVIVTEGEDGNEFFIIESGSCHCFKKHLNI